MAGQRVSDKKEQVEENPGAHVKGIRSVVHLTNKLTNKRWVEVVNH